MNLSGKEQIETSTGNVLSLFGRTSDEMIFQDPLSELIRESELEDLFLEEEVEVEVSAMRRVVTEEQFPDQSVYILQQQLEDLKNNISRIKFYLGDVDDLLPR